MPRSRRIVIVGAGLHVMCRGNEKQIVFHCRQDKKKYYKLMLSHMLEHSIHILHYCLMSNHVHLLLMPNIKSNISKFMQQVNLAYMSYYRYRYGLTGHLWQGRYKSVIVDTERYLMQCGKYIELNPVRAGYVSYPDQYAFSSYNFYSKGKPDKLITEDPLYTTLGPDAASRQKAYSEIVLDDKVMNKQSLSRKNIIGSNAFVNLIKQKIKTSPQGDTIIVERDTSALFSRREVNGGPVPLEGAVAEGD